MPYGLHNQLLPVSVNDSLAAHAAETGQQMQAFAHDLSMKICHWAEYVALICRELLLPGQLSGFGTPDPDTDLPATMGYEGDSCPDGQCPVHGAKPIYYADPFQVNFYCSPPLRQGAYGQNNGYNHNGYNHSHHVVHNNEIFRNNGWPFDPNQVEPYHHPPGNYYLHPRQPQPNCRNNDVIYHGPYGQPEPRERVSLNPENILNLVSQRIPRTEPRFAQNDQKYPNDASRSQPFQTDRGTVQGDRARIPIILNEWDRTRPRSDRDRPFQSDPIGTHREVKSKRSHRKHRKQSPCQEADLDARPRLHKHAERATSANSHRRDRSRRVKNRDHKRPQGKQQTNEGQKTEPKRHVREELLRTQHERKQRGHESRPWRAGTNVRFPDVSRSAPGARPDQYNTQHDNEYRRSDANDDDALYIGPCYRNDCEGDIYYKDPIHGKYYHRDSLQNGGNMRGGGGDFIDAS